MREDIKDRAPEALRHGCLRAGNTLPANGVPSKDNADTINTRQRTL